MSVKYTHWQDAHQVDWKKIASGTVLTKFVAVDEGTYEGDATVEIHGFRDAEGRFYITDEIVSPPKEIPHD